MKWNITILERKWVYIWNVYIFNNRKLLQNQTSNVRFQWFQICWLYKFLISFWLVGVQLPLVAFGDRWPSFFMPTCYAVNIALAFPCAPNIVMFCRVLPMSSRHCLCAVSPVYSQHCLCAASPVCIQHCLCAVSPVCSRSLASVYRAAVGQTVRLSCLVVANPRNVSFGWSFTNMAMQVRDFWSFTNMAIQVRDLSHACPSPTWLCM